MNKLILIGNGFDLAHRLKTSYDDFVTDHLTNAVTTFNRYRNYDGALIDLAGQAYKNGIGSVLPIESFINRFEQNAGLVREKNNFFYEIIKLPNSLGWADVEYQYYKRLVKYYKQIIQSPQSEHHVDTQVRRLNIEFESFKTEFLKYLDGINQIVPHLKKDNLKIVQEIDSHFQKIKYRTEKDRAHLHILNFNYTSTLDLYLKSFPEDTSVNYIHGRLGDLENPIVFGYGDEIDENFEKMAGLNKNHFLKYIKSYCYLKCSNYKKFDNFIQTDFEVFIMGHSCGISDRVLLSTIFDNPRCKNIEIMYHQKDQNEDDFFEKTQEISRHFKPESKARMRTLIGEHEKVSIPLIKYVK